MEAKRKKRSNKVALLRICDSAGEGPYRASRKTPAADFDHNSSNGRPIMSNYPLDNMRIFGFSSIVELLDWFTDKEIKHMEKHGFYLRVAIAEKKNVHLESKHANFYADSYLVGNSRLDNNLLELLKDFWKTEYFRNLAPSEAKSKISEIVLSYSGDFYSMDNNRVISQIWKICKGKRK